MVKWLVSALKAMNGFFKFQGNSSPGIVFYFEGAHDVPHLLPIARKLQKQNKNITLVSSEYLSEEYIFVGDGLFRILFFQMLNCPLIVMTMPDLERLHIKRSKNPVKYAYVFHSLSSSHTIYHQEAFDAYDIIFAAGPHHLNEIQKREELYQSKRKKIYEGGYPRIDSLLDTSPDIKAKKNKITIAPTWGNGSLIENHNYENILSQVLELQFDVYLRLHPMTTRHHPKLINRIKEKFKDKDNLFFETNMGDKKNLYESFMMISDWSGAAFDFSLTQKKPVLFIDTPQKINNPEYKKLNLPAAESSIREDVGKIVKLDELEKINEVILEFYENQDVWRERISNKENNYIYNLGDSSEKIANSLNEIVS